MNTRTRCRLAALAAIAIPLNGCGEDPAATSEKSDTGSPVEAGGLPWFENTIDSSGIDFVHQSGDTGLFR
ncbi:MAG: hypothetical protein MK085_05720, partial [Phycisphaerales bacterium]|nr:hypothetical protein [Phycisphaerales bacterium]